MYGFVEPWITAAFDLNHTPYGIGDGNVEAHIIDQGDFERIFILMRNYSSRATSLHLERPQIISSNVVGLKIMLMRYWANEDILFSLTDGPIKETQPFRYFMNMENPRFEMTRVLMGLRELEEYGQIRTMEIDPAYPRVTRPVDTALGGLGAAVGAEVGEAVGSPNTDAVFSTVAPDLLRVLEEMDAATTTTGDPMYEMQDTEVQEDRPLHVTLENIEDLENRAVLEAAASEVNVNHEVRQQTVVDLTEMKNAATPEVPKKEVVTEEMKIKIDGEAFINHLAVMSRTRFDVTTSRSKGGYLVLHHSNALSKNISAIYELADELKKNIVFGTYNAYVTEIKSRFNTRDIMKHTLVINLTPQACTDKQFVQPSVTNHVSCLGRMPFRPWIVYGSNVNSEINSARKNMSNDAVDSILNNHSNSPYFKYDCVFKDTYTGVVWAVKDRCVIHVLVDTTSNTEFFGLCIKEIARRIDGKTSYKELLKIDKEYFDSMNNSNMDQYVDFAVSNSKQIYNTLLDSLQSQKNNFNTYMAKAMECAKLVQRYEDQLAAFDMKAFEQRERDKALKTYQDTMALNKVKCITIDDGSVNVYTKNIYVKDPRSNKWHDIGTFHIILGMLGESYDTTNTVRVFNTKFSGMGMNGDFQAPHIYSDGHICHGNMASGMVAAYKERNLFDLIYQIIIFLQSVNVSDPAGNYINSWPEVTEEFVQTDEAEADLVYEKVSEEEKKFDEAVCDAIPIHIN